MEPAQPDRPAWGFLKRFLFRVLVVYVILFCFPFPLEVVPVVGEVLSEDYAELWHKAVPWVGERVFGIEIKFRPGGSGDTTYNYVQLVCYLAIALAAAIVWTVLDRKRPSYPRLHEWLRVYLRFMLGATMIYYGAIKVIPVQMGPPWLGKLIQPIGEASPMGLLWTFMGASDSYMIFSGAAEMLGGLLLVFRRTTLLGALVSIGVMSNVAMMNYSYDVPVKIFSTHLLLMGVFLAAPDLKRLANLFLLNRPVAPAADPPLFANRSGHRAALVFRTLFVLFITFTALQQAWKGYREYRVGLPKPRAHGIWEVEDLSIDGQPRPLLATDADVWRRVIFEWPGVVGIQRTSDSRPKYYQLKLVKGPYQFEMTAGADPEWKGGLSYRLVSPKILTLESEYEGKRIAGRFRRMDETRFRLVSRGFHWINEFPHNR